MPDTTTSSNTKVRTITFGCRLNSVESEAISDMATSAGMQDVVILNTCAVTAEAVRQAGQEIRRVNKKHPDSHIIVTGCAAQVERQKFAEMDEVDLVVSNHEKLARSTWEAVSQSILEVDSGKYDITSKPGTVQDNNGTDLASSAGSLVSGGKALSSGAGPLTPSSGTYGASDYMVNGIRGHARAFVPIQNGCDHHCTFCVIPHSRGASRSTNANHIVDQISRLVDNGFNEVVLTGVDITSWGQDLPGSPSFGHLLSEILRRVDRLPRLRISSIDSVELDEETIDLIAREARIMPHLHLSIQSGDDMILKRMRRRHSRGDIIKFCDRMRSAREGILLGADLIAGFPTETPDMFENSVRLVRECELAPLHVFPFSPRPNTPAARMPQIDRHTIKKRAARLRAVGQAEMCNRFDREIGQSRRILIEKNDQGRTEHFLKTKITTKGNTSHKYQTGEIVVGCVVDHDGQVLDCVLQ